MAGSDSLESKQISSTYKDLLQVPNANSGVDGTARTVMDGEGTESALQVSTAGVKSTGTLESTGNLTVGGTLTLGGTQVTSTATELNLLDGVTAVDTDLSSVSSSDDTLASAKSIKTYVDSQVQSKDDLSELSGTLDDISAGTTNKHFTATDETKLDGIETSADVTDATNVEAAGALMDSELTDLAGVKGVTISTLQPKPSEGAFVDGDKTKLDGIESSADVTDATNVEAAGALMDSELTDLAGVKGVTISTLQPKPSEGAFADGDKTKLDGITASANNYSHPNHSGEVTSTGDGATVIADNVVDEANLKVSNSPTDGYSLVARSGETGGLKWESVSGGGGGGGSASAAGSTGYLQFNDGSNNFDASSNLVWDDTNDRLGIGSSSPSGKLEVNTGSGIAYFTRTAGDDGSLNPALGIGADSTKCIIKGYGGIQIETAATGGSAAPRLTIDSSGNIGINTTSPSASAKLHVLGEGLLGNATNKLASYGILELSRAGDPYLFLRNTNSQGVGNSGFIEFYQKNGNGSEVATSRIGGSTEATHATQPSGNLKFYTASSGGSLSERMRIDSSGASYFYGQLNVAGGSGTTTNRLNISYNASNGVAEIAPDSNSGNTELKLSTCLSGTKSERMRIDSSGKIKFLNGAVGIGGTHTSSGQLDVLGTNTSTDITSVAGAGISLRNTSSTDNNYSFIRFDAASGNVASGISGVTTDQSPTRGELSFATTGSSGYAERMRIDSSGRVGIGTDSSGPQTSLHVVDATDPVIRVQNTSANPVNGGAIHFAEAAGPDGFKIQHDGNNNRLNFEYVTSSTESTFFTLQRNSGRVTVKKSSNAEVTALTDGATIDVDLNDSNNFSLTLGGTRTLNNPSNLTAGQSGIITITQDGTGSRALSYGSYWKFSGGTAPSLTTTAGAVDVLAYYVESADRITATIITDTKQTT